MGPIFYRFSIGASDETKNIFPTPHTPHTLLNAPHPTPHTPHPTLPRSPYSPGGGSSS
ncbi:MAG: hypothetical protein F6J93_02435 [Oscillatoria sp. SIO1A7]|nr:hypothetical protein [Oscillatoria sp. SIO1A7]